METEIDDIINSHLQCYITSKRCALRTPMHMINFHETAGTPFFSSAHPQLWSSPGRIPALLVVALAVRGCMHCTRHPLPPPQRCSLSCRSVYLYYLPRVSRPSSCTVCLCPTLCLVQLRICCVVARFQDLIWASGGPGCYVVALSLPNVEEEAPYERCGPRSIHQTRPDFSKVPAQSDK